MVMWTQGLDGLWTRGREGVLLMGDSQLQLAPAVARSEQYQVSTVLNRVELQSEVLIRC